MYNDIIHCIIYAYMKRLREKLRFYHLLILTLQYTLEGPPSSKQTQPNPAQHTVRESCWIT